MIFKVVFYLVCVCRVLVLLLMFFFFFLFCSFPTASVLIIVLNVWLVGCSRHEHPRLTDPLPPVGFLVSEHVNHVCWLFF